MNKRIKITDKVSLPINQETINEFVPKSSIFENYNNLFEQLAVAINNRFPILLIGETGTGKTSLVRYLANKTRNGFRRVNHNGATTVDDIIGKVLINEKGTYWVDGVLINAMRKGYWYLADEINAAPADINFAYHSLLYDDGYIVLSENDGEIVRPHPDFRFFAAMNPAVDYAGTKEMNKALLSRFVVFKTDYPTPDIEIKVLTKRTKIESDVAEKMVKFATEIRINYGKGKTGFVLSTRDLLQWAKMYKVYQKYVVSAEMTVLNKTNNEDFESIKDLIALHFKNLDEPLQEIKKDEEKPKEDDATEVEVEVGGVGSGLILSG